MLRAQPYRSASRALVVFLALTAWMLPSRLQAQNTPSQGQAPSANTPLDKAVLGKLLDSYATIAGGWYLEQRCNHFGKELKAEFDWNVAQTNMALSRQADASFLRQLQQSARKVAEGMACGSETEKLVQSTLLMSRNTTRLLTGQIYSPATSLAYDAQRITVVLAAQKLDDKCKLMPSNFRSEFDSRVAMISKSFIQSSGSAAFDTVKMQAAESLKNNDSCDPKLIGFLQHGLAFAREMSPSWKPN